jgi:hypothetical protein
MSDLVTRLRETCHHNTLFDEVADYIARLGAVTRVTLGGCDALMTASNQTFLVMDVGSPKGAFTTRHELQAFLQRRREAFVNPLVYTFWGSQSPSIMTLAQRPLVIC